MGKQGRRTPEAIERFVVETYLNARGLTYRQIADKVEEKFGAGARPDRSTVPNILRRYGVAIGQAPGAGTGDRQISATEERGKLRLQLANQLGEGTKILNGFRSVVAFSDYHPEEEFREWREQVSGILLGNGLIVEQAQWLRYTEIPESLHPLNEYKAACEDGLDYLGILINRTPS